jgi:hypothetical protein
MKTDEKKVTNENPVSLNPLTFNEALKGLLQVKSQPPKPKDEKPKTKRKPRTKKPSN